MLYQQGRLTESLARIGRSTASGDVLLRAQILLCLNRPSELVRADIVGHLANVDEQYRFLAQAFLASAYFRVGAEETGSAVLSEAYQSAARSHVLHATLWVDYYHAYHLWTRRDFDGAKKAVQPILGKPGVLGARALSLAAWIEAGKENYRDQIAFLRKALQILPPNEDAFTAACILHALATLSCDVFDLSLAKEVEQYSNRLPWSEDMQTMRIEITRSVAWNCALAGQQVEAMKLLRKNELHATNPADKVLSLLDRTRICFGTNEVLSYRAFLESADEMAAKVDWANARGEQRFALLTLAALWAPSDPLHARGILEKYQAVSASSPKTSAWGNGDRRRLAAEHYAAGVICRYLNAKDEARHHLLEAFNIYSQIEYYWRAALAAIHLDAVGYDRSVMEACLAWVRAKFPNAWFRPLLTMREHLEANDAYRQLTRTQRSILEMLIQGATTKEIARSLDRVEQTIRNHANAIYRAFGVHRQEDLIRICTERRVND